jgi:hypothetical protein
MAKVIFGNHSSVLVPWQDRDSIRKFYCDVLGGKIMKADPAALCLAARTPTARKIHVSPFKREQARNPSSWRAPEPRDSIPCKTKFFSWPQSYRQKLLRS